MKSLPLQPGPKRSANILLVFLAVWTVINLIQAGLVDLHADEAYYWMYSRFPAWGYFDHPPMVAMFIMAGDTISHTNLGLRVITVFSSTISLYVLWQMLRPYGENIKLFILLFGSVVLFHVYGFITTPDAPLALFIVLFFYIYQRYEREDHWLWTALLALVIAGLLYSKYHAILVLFFTVLSNLKLLRRVSFWMVVAAALVFFLPHIWWQAQHHYPSYYYHVIDRSASSYKFSFTTDYLIAQLALAGPLVGWFLYRSSLKARSSDAWIRAIKFNFYGIFGFFLLSTLKGRVEAHWTLPAMLCLFILAYISLADRPVAKWFERLAILNIGLIIVTRLILIIPIPALDRWSLVNYYFDNARWAREIQHKAGGTPVIFYDSFQAPSRYNYYTHSTQGFAYDSRYYRKNQYDIWPLEDSLRHKKVYLLLQESRGATVHEDTIPTVKGLYYGSFIDSVRIYQKLVINPVKLPERWKNNTKQTLTLKISNPYEESVSLGNSGQKWPCYLEYAFKQGDNLSDFKLVDCNLENIRIPAGQSADIAGTIEAPAMSGKYKLVLSLRTEPFRGSRNSNMVPIEIQ